jgi:hypothetical protein
MSTRRNSSAATKVAAGRDAPIVGGDEPLSEWLRGCCIPSPIGFRLYNNTGRGTRSPFVLPDREAVAAIERRWSGDKEPGRTDRCRSGSLIVSQ